MSDDVELKLISSVSDEDVASDILEKISTEGIISWRELVDMYRGKGVSLYRLRKILLILLHERKIIELPCRLFTTAVHLEKTPINILKEEIIEKIRRLGLRKCGKPISIPEDKVSVSISRRGAVSVVVQ